MGHNFETLRNQISGGIVLPSDSSYDETRSVYNAMVDKRPSCIAMCQNADDVVAAVNFARNNDVQVSIRGGGHNAGGLGIWDNALCIDLGGLKDIQVNTSNNTVKVGGGCVWSEVDEATHPHGLAVPCGIISSTGVGGLALGGGIGHLSRAFGLTVDNFVEVDMVLASGEKVTANQNQNADLFWAVRGGGGNFGVVTTFTFQAHPVRNVIAGPTFWDLDRSEEILKWYRNFIVNAPRELNGFFAFLEVPASPPFPDFAQGQRVCGVVWCYTGDHAKFDEVFAEVRATNPMLDGTHEVPFPGLNSVFDQFYPKGDQWYWRADFVNEINDEAVMEHMKYGTDLPTGLSTMHLYPIDGACHDVAAGDTPFAYRESNWAQVMVGVDKTPENNDKLIKWTRDYFDALHPYSAGGAYVNFLNGDEGQERVKATYRGNYDKLTMIKAKYDPKNFFRVNQNIRPAVAETA